MSARTAGTSLWLIRSMDGGRILADEAHLFAGSHAEMVEHVAELHARTGRQHAAREVE